MTEQNKPIPNLTRAKLIRVDKKNKNLLVWFGEPCIKIYPLTIENEIQSVPVNDPTKDWITYSCIRKAMKKIIKGD